MQQGGQYGGGMYPSTAIPADYAGIYGGSPTGYGSAPPSAPSAPAFAAPFYHQPTPSGNSSPYNSQPAPEPSYSFQSGAHGNSSNSYGPPSNPDPGPAASSYSNAYPPSYASLIPSYQAAVPAYDRSFEFGVGAAPTSSPFDSSAPSQRSNYGNVSYGAAPQQVPAAYEGYSQGHEAYSQGELGRYDQGGTVYGLGRSDSGHYGNGGGNDRSSDNGGFLDAYAYDGGGAEPYGARSGSGSSWSAGGTGSLGGYNSLNDTEGSKARVVRATPKVEDRDAESGGVQKFRVKLLPEARSTDSIKEVVCQIGLDGVRMVDPSTSRTLRIYPLDTITKWEVKEPSVFTFWAKSAVDIDQRMIQLKSSTVVTTAILDTLTAACVQLCEMVGKDGTGEGTNSASSTTTTSSESSAAKKGSFVDWVALRSRAAIQEEKHHWVPDEAVTKCNSCDSDFGAFLRRHHCRNCGDIFCDKCTRGRIALNTDDDSQPVRVCDRCLAEVTQRLDNTKIASSKVPVQRTHEDLAKKLQEEMERNAGRKQPALGRSSSSHASPGQTSVVNCSKCGSITLVTGGSSRCSNCESSSRSPALDRRGSSFGASGAPHGPPHLWSSNTQASDASGPQMREVACPTCTVHLQVQVPSFGTETVECGVCQHPFLVAA